MRLRHVNTSMHRREFLRGVVGTTGLGTVALGTGTGGGVETATAHPGPYRPFGSVAVADATEAVPDANGEYAYVAAMDGFAVVDVRIPSDPQVVFEARDLLADRETGPLRGIQDVKVEGDRLVVAGPADPMRGDVLQGVLLYDVSDPADPEQVAFFETDYPIHNCFLRDGVVYLTARLSDRNALVVVDASGDDPTEIGRWSLADRDDRWLEVPTGLWTVHDVWVRDDRAYLSHWDAGLVVLDVSDPANPAFVSRFAGRSLDDLLAVPSDQSRAHVVALPGNVHYAMTDDAGELLALNREAWQAGGEGGPGGVELWDLSDEASPERLSTIDAPPSPDPTTSGVWTTSHNLDLVDGRLFTSWYQGGVKIHDVTDPSNPEEMAWWRKPGETAFWTAKRATPGVFVASSIGDYLGGVEGEAGLYTFPIEADEQKSPPTLTTTGDGTGNGDGTGGGGTNDGNGTASGSSNGDGGASTTAEQAALAGGTTTVESASGGSTGSTPGLGVASGLAALLGAGAWWSRRD